MRCGCVRRETRTTPTRRERAKRRRQRDNNTPPPPQPQRQPPSPHPTPSPATTHQRRRNKTERPPTGNRPPALTRCPPSPGPCAQVGRGLCCVSNSDCSLCSSARSCRRALTGPAGMVVVRCHRGGASAGRAVPPGLVRGPGWPAACPPLANADPLTGGSRPLTGGAGCGLSNALCVPGDGAAGARVLAVVLWAPLPPPLTVVGFEASVAGPGAPRPAIGGAAGRAGSSSRNRTFRAGRAGLVTASGDSLTGGSQPLTGGSGWHGGRREYAAQGSPPWQGCCRASLLAGTRCLGAALTWAANQLSSSTTGAVRWLLRLRTLTGSATRHSPAWSKRGSAGLTGPARASVPPKSGKGMSSNGWYRKAERQSPNGGKRLRRWEAARPPQTRGEQGAGRKEQGAPPTPQRARPSYPFPGSPLSRSEYRVKA